MQRIEFGNAQGIGQNRSGGTAATRSENDALVLAPHDKVLNNQEIAIEAHAVHDRQLVRSPFEYLFGDMSLGFVNRQLGSLRLIDVTVTPSESSVD